MSDNRPQSRRLLSCIAFLGLAAPWRKESLEGFFIFRIPEIAEVSTVWIEVTRPLNVSLSASMDFLSAKEIIDVVQNMNLGIATQPIHYGCQGASLEMARKCGYEGSASAIFETYRVAADVCNTGNWKSN
jgi:hypothetical protein